MPVLGAWGAWAGRLTWPTASAGNPGLRSGRGDLWSGRGDLWSGRGEGGEEGPGPVAVAVLAGVEAVAGELASPRGRELGRHLGDRETALAGDLVDDPVDPGDVGHAHPAHDPPEPRKQRQVEHDGLVRDLVEQRAHVAEQLGGGAVQDVVGADATGDEIRGGGKLRELFGQDVANQRAGDGEVAYPPVLAGAAPQLPERLADVAVPRPGGAEALSGGVAERHPEGAGVFFEFAEHALVVRVPVGGERDAILAQGGHAIGPAAELSMADAAGSGVRAPGND